MNTLSIPVVAMASISLYVGSLSSIDLFQTAAKPRGPDVCIALLCNRFLRRVLCRLVQRRLGDRRRVLAAGTVRRTGSLCPAFLWFVSDYTHQKPGIAIYLFSAFYLVALIVQLVDRSGLTFPVEQLSIKYITLPYVQITYYETAPGPFTTVQSLMGVIATTYVLSMGIRYFRRGYKREAVPLILAIVFIYATGIQDTSVSHGIYDFIYLFEYAYLGLILLMAYSLSNTVMDAVRAKDGLRKSEERFRSLVETTSDWVWEVDTNSVYTYASPKVRDLLGYEPEEIIGQTPFDLMPAEETNRVSVIFQNIMHDQKPFEGVENITRGKDGRLLTLETSGVPFFDSAGRLLGYRGIDRDITERKLAEQALRAKTEELDRYFNSGLDLLCIADTEGYFRRVNPEWETMLGYTVAELEGRKFLEFVHPEDVQATITAMSRLAEQQQVLNFENRYRCKDGSYRWIEWRSYPEGKMIYAVARDITRRKQMEEALRKSEQKFRLFVEQSSDGLVFTDEQGTILEWNQSQEYLTTLASKKVSAGHCGRLYKTCCLLPNKHVRWFRA